MTLDLLMGNVSRGRVEAAKAFTVAQVPFAGFVAMKSGTGAGFNFISQPGDDIDHVNRLTELAQSVRASRTGYVASAVFGLPGENTASAAAGGLLCLMPCHWAAYAAAFAKFTPLAAYFAKPQSCCHSAGASVGEQVVNFGMNAVFYGTVAGLAVGIARRVMRKQRTDSLLAVIDACGEKLARNEPLCVVEEDGYEQINQAAASVGLSELLSERARQEYSRLPSGVFGKAIHPVRKGFQRAKRMLVDARYCETGRAISAAYGALAREAEDVSATCAEDRRSAMRAVSKVYARESVAFKNPFSPVGLAKKMAAYVSGFSSNHCRYGL